MIPGNLTLSTNSSALEGLTDRFPVPAQGSVTRYLAFFDPSTVTTFECRRRVSRRHKTSETFDEWSEWTEWSETIALKPDGMRISTTALTVASTDVNPTSYDCARWEFQVRETTDDDDAPWSVSLFALAYYVPNLACTCTLSGTNEVVVTFSSAWARNGNTVIVEDVLIGQTTVLSALPSALIAPERLTYKNVNSGGSIRLSAWLFKRYPQSAQYLTFVVRYATCDAEVDKIYYLPVLMTYSAANAPAMTLSPHPEEGYVEIVVTDGGGSKTPTSVSVLMLDGAGSFDLLPVTLGTPVRHWVAPLDVDITYQAIFMASDGSRSTLTKTTQLTSKGRLWLNHGSGFAERIELRANANWGHTWSRKKNYFDIDKGYPKVFLGKQKSNAIPITGEVIWPRSQDECEALAWADTCIFREPYGRRRVISIDDVATSDSANTMQTIITINAQEVSGWQST
jgi:hypothetical protein